MLREHRWLVSAAALLGLIHSALPAAAQVLLKPRGEESVPLRRRAVRAEVRIDRQFASTKLALTFHNETGRWIEADFLYGLPPETVVTYFAYWYGHERVVARIVAKERAAEIYGHITSRLRDPALIEMIDENTFRARIFPVMPNADLKVEMTLVQVLPSDAEGVYFELPLAAERGDELDAVDVDVCAGLPRNPQSDEPQPNLRTGTVRERHTPVSAGCRPLPCGPGPEGCSNLRVPTRSSRCVVQAGRLERLSPRAPFLDDEIQCLRSVERGLWVGTRTGLYYLTFDTLFTRQVDGHR